eukprot:scaffold4870_cov135-Cylindrotheca_fusiformis.AAC.7
MYCLKSKCLRSWVLGFEEQGREKDPERNLNGSDRMYITPTDGNCTMHRKAYWINTNPFTMELLASVPQEETSDAWEGIVHKCNPTRVMETSLFLSIHDESAFRKWKGRYST